MPKNTNYEDFLEKFRAKKTTDDCYTPPLVYDAVLKWVKDFLHIADRTVVRPFYPGGDYVNYDYPDNCVVVDNPPFSIFSKIVDWYQRKGISFFLFAPALTSIRPNATFVGVGVQVTYDNGAKVNTSFVTNLLGKTIATTAPELHTAITSAIAEINKTTKKQVAKLGFPDCVLRASMLHTMSGCGIDFSIKEGEGIVVPDCINRKGGTFGNSILLNKEKVEEKKTIQEKCKKIRVEQEHARQEHARQEHARLTPQALKLLESLNK